LTAAGVTVAALAVVYGSCVRKYVQTGETFNVGTSGFDNSAFGLQASNKPIPEANFYRGLLELLRQNYVESIDDEQKLAVGAVKGMVNGLKDPRCVFMDANEFKAYTDAQSGKYQGIGVDLAFELGTGKKRAGSAGADDLAPADMAALAIPRLKVIAVTPGGPADVAGVKVGDWVESVEDHWVLNPAPVTAYRKAVDAARPDATKNLPPAQALKLQTAARSLASDLDQKIHTMIMPLRAKDLLTIGEKGAIKIMWHRGDALRPTIIGRHISQVPIVQTKGSTITLRFAAGSADKLKEAIAGKAGVTIDLRNNSIGDYNAMLQCLSVVAPSGTYGEIHVQKDNKSRAFSIGEGNAKPPKMTLLVDNSTTGAAGIFASALVGRHLATLSGTPPSDASVIEVVNLPDGSGYTLAIGKYSAKPVIDMKRVALRPKKSRFYAERQIDGSVVAMAGSGGNA
jgi:carboxyl-terminal processing protease